MNDSFGINHESIITSAERALRWILAHIEQCNPFCSSEYPTEAIETALAEHLLLLFVLSKRKSPFLTSGIVTDKLIYELRQSLQKICIEARQLDYCTRLPTAAFALPCLTMLCFEEQSEISLYFSKQHLIQITSDFSQANSIIPWKQCEAHYFCCLLKNNFYFTENLVEQLHQAILIASNIEDLTPIRVYDLAHLIFYITNFGHSSEIGGFNCSLLKNILTDVIKVMLQWQHIDLLGEMIVAWNCVVELVGYNNTYALALQKLNAQQMVDGAFRHSVNEGEKQQYTTEIYLSEYHEILVTILANATIKSNATR